MSSARQETQQQSPAVEIFLLGRVEYGRCLQLQRRLVAQVGGRDDGQIVLLLCEHPPIVTVGRGGSPAEIMADGRVFRSRQIEVHWVNRGGGCLVHCPGQLAVYPLAPLRWYGWTVGEYIERLQAGIIETLDELGIRGHTPPGRFGVWGRTGQLAALGVAVRDWVTYYGAYLNVCPAMGLFRLVESDPIGHSRMSCLMAERRGSARMAAVRATLVRHLSEALGCQRYHLYSGHPMLREERG
jgi:lipoyl(octanoyl) transferase